MVDAEKEELFLVYFGEKANFYLNKEKRDFQIMRNPQSGERQQVYQVDVVSEYAYLFISFTILFLFDELTVY